MPNTTTVSKRRPAWDDLDWIAGEIQRVRMQPSTPERDAYLEVLLGRKAELTATGAGEGDATGAEP